MLLTYRAKTTFVLFPLLLAASWPGLHAEENRLMPQPAKLVWGSGRLEIGGPSASPSLVIRRGGSTRRRAVRSRLSRARQAFR